MFVIFPPSSTHAQPVVHVDGFTMVFAKRTVIEGLSFDVLRGETFGFLGSNGSGKTTTIRALLGIYRATAGTLHIKGLPFSPDNGVRLGYLPEERGLYKKEPVLDVMVYFARLKGLAHDSARRWSLDFLERVDLAHHAATRLDRLSSGQQQKVQLGVTIMNQPELLILDEPTKGFDPVNRRLLMDIIDDEKRRGTTVMMVTHQMDEVERLCDRIIFLKDGCAEAYGTVTEVQDRYGAMTIRVRYAGDIPDSPRYRVTLRERNYAELTPTGHTAPSDVLASLIGAGVAVSEFTTNRRSLDEIFVMVYGDEVARMEH